MTTAYDVALAYDSAVTVYDGGTFRKATSTPQTTTATTSTPQTTTATTSTPEVN